VKRSSHFTLISLHLFHSDGVGADLYFAESNLEDILAPSVFTFYSYFTVIRKGGKNINSAQNVRMSGKINRSLNGQIALFAHYCAVADRSALIA
jgi:hypothetical protein